MEGTPEIVALVLTFAVHVIGGAFLVGALLGDDGRRQLRGWWPRDDRPDDRPRPPAPAPSGARAPLPLPGAAPSPVRLREPGRLADAAPRPARRPEHAPEPARPARAPA